MRRRILLVLAGALVLVLLAGPGAVAKDLGTDVLGNISPAPQPGGTGLLVDRYPLSAYALDFHTDVGITELDGVPPTIAQWAAAQIWSLTSFLLKTVIDLFTWRSRSTSSAPTAAARARSPPSRTRSRACMRT